MPDPETASLFDWAVLWAITGRDEYNNATLAAPVEIAANWQKTRRQVVTVDGSTVAVEAVVEVDQEIEPGSVVWEGRLEDIPGTALVPESGLYEVVTCPVTNDVRGRATYTKVTLMRRTDTLRP